MKVVKTDSLFTPVTIVLETQEEVNWTTELFGSVGGLGRARSFVDAVYKELKQERKEAPEAFGGSVYVKTN